MTQPAEPRLPDVGTRVVLSTAVDRFPDALVPEGRSGVVTSATEEMIVLALDEHQPGLEEWDNALAWNAGVHTEDGQSVAEAFWSEVEQASPSPTP